MKIDLNELLEELNKVWIYDLAESGFGEMDLIPEDEMGKVEDKDGMVIYVSELFEVINKLKQQK